MGKTINTVLNLKDKFSNTILRTEKNTKQFKSTLKEANLTANNIIKTFGSGVKGAIAFGGALSGITGLGATAASKSFIEYDEAARQAAASTGATAKEMTQLKDAMKDVYKNNFGESWDDIGRSVASVNKYLSGTDENLSNVTQKALTLRDAFGPEVQESMRSVDALMKNFDVTADEAFNLIAQGYQNNLDFSNEFGDSINEYSVHFKKAGIDAETMFSIYAAGAKNGAWNLDKIGDAVKEFSIRAIDGSKTTQEGYTLLGLSADELSAKFAAGGDSAKSAFAQVIQGLKNMEDPLVRDTAGVDLFGTMWEDLGADVITNLTNVENKFDKTKDTMASINDVKYGGILNKFKGIARQIQVAAMPIGEALMPELNKLGDWLENKLPPKIEKVSGFIENNVGRAIEFGKSAVDKFTKGVSFLKNNLDIIIPVLAGTVSGFAAFAVITKTIMLVDMFRKATQSMTIAQALLNSTILGNPIFWMAAGVGALIGVFALAYAKSERFRNAIGGLFGKIKEFGTAVKKFGTEKLAELAPWFDEKIKPSITAISSNLSELYNRVLKPIGNFMGSVFGPLFGAGIFYVKNEFINFINAAQGVAEGIFGVFNGIITFITGVFTGNWTKAWSGVVTVFSGIATGIKSVFGGIINGVVNRINSVITGVNGLASKASNIPALSWAKNINIPLIPTFAKGTNYFKGGAALVGEEGPEIVKLPGASKVIPANKTQNLLSGRQSPMVFNIHIHGNFYGNEAAIEQLGSSIVSRILNKLKNA